MATSAHRFDICIVGGGIVGLTAAGLLARAGLTIAVVEQSNPTELTMVPSLHDYDLRVSAINLASMQIFQHLDIAQPILLKRASPYLKMQIWDANSDARVVFDCDDIEREQLGFIIENSLMISFLVDSLKQNNEVQFFAGASPKQLSEHAKGIKIDLGSECINAQLLIGADGQYSRVRSLAKMPTEMARFNQSALVCRIETELPHQQTAYQCFHHRGPIAYLPLADGSSSIVWSCDTDYADTLQALEDADFAKAVATAMQSKLGQVKILSTRAAFDLTQQHAKSYFTSRIALIGDAAHRTHPLAGLGANLGLQDAAVLAEIILQAKQNHRHFYGISALRQYERRRKHQNALILNAMQAFKTGFASPAPGMSALRDLALNSVNQIGPLRSLIIRLATGLSGDLAHICRPEQHQSL